MATCEAVFVKVRRHCAAEVLFSFASNAEVDNEINLEIDAQIGQCLSK